jgi:multidrug efflux pump subunit AcrB
MIGLALAMIGMYILLTIQFTSYLQPILIMMIIPFGCIGAIAGHFWLGLPVTMFSLFGLVALTGVVVNDSIVLIDFINHRMADGMPLHDAIIDAGRRRFRPVLLTSVTTVAGLTPILLETSLQAQFLIPMAASLSFGIMTSTVLVLILVPSFYCIMDILFKIGPRPEKSPVTESAIAEPAIAG